jgi:hypothetical protein
MRLQEKHHNRCFALFSSSRVTTPDLIRATSAFVSGENLFRRTAVLCPGSDSPHLACLISKLCRPRIDLVTHLVRSRKFSRSFFPFDCPRYCSGSPDFCPRRERVGFPNSDQMSHITKVAVKVAVVSVPTCP